MISQWPIYNGTWFHRRSRICFRMNSVSHSFLINVNRAVKYSLKTHVRNVYLNASRPGYCMSVGSIVQQEIIIRKKFYLNNMQQFLRIEF